MIPSKWKEESGPLPVWVYGSHGTGNPKFSFLALLEVEGMTQVTETTTKGGDCPPLE